jgi:hypothetical protein
MSKDKNNEIEVVKANNLRTLADMFDLTPEQAQELVVMNPEEWAAFRPSNVRALQMKKANLGGKKLDEFGMPQVKSPSGNTPFFQVVGKPMEKIHGICIEKAERRKMYKTEAVTGGPPDCASVDMKVGHGDPGSEHPGPNPDGSYSCVVCPWDKFGSALRGRGKKCKEGETLFFLRREDVLPLVVSVPPSALKDWTDYKSQLSVPFMLSVMELSLAPDKNADNVEYQKMKFKQIGVLPIETFHKAKQYAKLLSSLLAGIDEETYDRVEEILALPAPAA